MRKKILLLAGLFVLFFLTGVSAQLERVYVQTDRSNYIKGETIYFKGHVLSDIDSVVSTNLFIELWDDTFNKLTGLSLPVIDGSAAGSLLIPKDLTGKQVFLRAYSDITAIQASPFQFIKPLMGQTRGLNESTQNGPVFFPEGGNLVVNAWNHLVFRASPGFSGIIKNNKEEEIANIIASANGLGSFLLKPVAGETYSCHWQNNGTGKRSPLPVPVDNKIAVHVYQSPDTLFFDLDNGGNPDQRVRKPKVQLLIGNEMAYVVELNMLKADKFSYFIPLQDFKPAMAEFKVLDSVNATLASRPVFLTKKSFRPGTGIQVVKKDLSKRGENIVRFNFNDTLLNYLSVTVTDATQSEDQSNPGIASVLLPNDISSFNDPGSLDLAVQAMPVGVSGNTTLQTVPGNNSPRYLQLSGVIKKGKKPLAEKEVLIGIRSEYTGKELYKVITDDQGRFVLDGMVLYDDAFIHARLPKSDDELTTEFKLELPQLNTNTEFFNAFKKTATELNSRKDLTANSKANEQADTIVFEKGITLEEVVIKTDPVQVTRKRQEELEKKYVDHTMFGGYHATGETLDVMNDPMSGKFLDVFSYIGSKMRSVSMRLERGVKQLVYFGRGQGGQTMVTVFYLGNMRVERDMLDGITLDQVAVIKFVPMLGSERGFPPALAIFLKKAGDQGYWEKDRYQLFEQTIKGYTVTKDFQAPDYRNEQVKVQHDSRKTILWNPYLPVDKGVAELRFYNTDIARKLRIVLAGIAPDGSIIFLEKIIE